MCKPCVSWLSHDLIFHPNPIQSEFFCVLCLIGGAVN